jgi:hypothetical protein
MVIDTAMEIKVGVGADWYPQVLGTEDITLQELTAEYLNVGEGDAMSIKIDFSSLIGPNSMLKMLSLMTA